MRDCVYRLCLICWAGAQVTLVGESFGGCLALRVAAEAPAAVGALVLVNPATCFRKSLAGVSSLIAATNLLSLFPKPLYEVRVCHAVPWRGSGRGRR